MISKKLFIPAIICNLFILISELTVVITELPVRGFSSLNYYTVLSNLLGMVAAVLFICSAITSFKRLNKTRTLLRYYATCMLSFTFIVVFTMLVPLAHAAGMGTAFLLTEGAAPVQHIINPVLSFVSFMFFEDNSLLKKRQPLIMLSLTLLYAFIMIGFNIARMANGPYPFFQVYDYPIVMIILWLAGLIGVTYLINFLIYRFCRKGS